MRPEDRYPRFGATYRRFIDGWDVFLRFARDHDLGMLKANQYELTYINHVAASGEGFPTELEHILPLFSWSPARSLGYLPTPAAVGMRLRFPLPEKSGSLHLKVDHGRRKQDDQEILLLEFTARGAAAPDCSDLARWFAVAHAHIVNGFTDLTSSAAHERWGKIE
jgi:uncharacterized protein (TIGR04255 family)